MEDHDIKKMIYRLKYRGSKELDLFLEKLIPYIQRDIMSSHYQLIREFLSENENDIQAWILRQCPCPPKYIFILKKIF